MLAQAWSTGSGTTSGSKPALLVALLSLTLFCLLLYLGVEYRKRYNKWLQAWDMHLLSAGKAVLTYADVC
jgi:hypothetical protein